MSHAPKVFRQYGSTALLSVALSDAMPIIWVADADAIKIITSDKHVFQKDVEAVRVLSFFPDKETKEMGLASMRCSTLPRRI
jgi:hypothetical protein